MPEDLQLQEALKICQGSRSNPDNDLSGCSKIVYQSLAMEAPLSPGSPEHRGPSRLRSTTSSAPCPRVTFPADGYQADGSRSLQKVLGSLNPKLNLKKPQNLKCQTPKPFGDLFVSKDSGFSKMR